MGTIIELIKSLCSLSDNSFMSMSRRNLISHIREIQKEVDCLDFYVNSLEAEIRADERKKFAEWCKMKGYSCYDWRMLIEQYEKEQKNDGKDITNNRNSCLFNTLLQKI